LDEILRRRIRRVDDEHVPPADVLVDLHEDLAVGEAADRQRAQRLPQMPGHLLGERPIGRPGEQQQLAPRQRELRHFGRLKIDGKSQKMKGFTSSARGSARPASAGPRSRARCGTRSRRTRRRGTPRCRRPWNRTRGRGAGARRGPAASPDARAAVAPGASPPAGAWRSPPPPATRIQRPPVLSTPSRVNEPELSAASSAGVESRNAANSSVTAWRDAAYPLTVQAVSAPFTRTTVSAPRVIVTRSAAASETGGSPSDAVIRSLRFESSSLASHSSSTAASPIATARSCRGLMRPAPRPAADTYPG